MFGVHINHLAWGGSPQAFGMVGKTSKACIADNGMVSLVHAILFDWRVALSTPLHNYHTVGKQGVSVDECLVGFMSTTKQLSFQIEIIQIVCPDNFELCQLNSKLL